MSSAATTYEHIVLDDAGIPVIEGANTKVIEIVLHTRAYGISPEQLHLELPHLSLGHIHSALAYYWDHKAELDADMDRRFERVEQLRQETPEPPVVERLRRVRNS